MKKNMNSVRIILLSALALMAAPPRSVAQTPIVETLPPTDMLNDTATFNGTANPNGAETTVWFEWGTIHDNGYDNHTEPQNVGGGTTAAPITASLSNLVQGVSYHYRLAASNSFGVVRGGEQRFWTPRIDLHAPAFQTHKRGTPFIDPATVHGFPTAVAVGRFHGLALRPDGTVVAWGDNTYGQCTVPVGATNVMTIAAGNYHSLAVRSDGSVVAWGRNDYGQCTVPAGATDVVAIAAGSGHSLVLRGDGAVVAWGRNDFGECSVPPSAANVVAIAAGSLHSMALRDDGTVIAWGWNYYDQCTVPAGATNVVAVATGGSHNMALRDDGTVIAWGWNEYGQCTVPAGATNVVAIAAGGQDSLALRDDGSLVGWGSYHYYGELIPASATNVVAIASTGHRSLALRSDGWIIEWAADGYRHIHAPMDILDLPLAINGTVDANTAGTYVLGYSTTNALGAVATATRTVEVVHVATEPATEMFNDSATFNGTANPNGKETTVWFEWGSMPNDLGNQTEPQSIGDGTTDMAVTTTLTGLTPGILYHYRLVASNSTWVARCLKQRFWTPAIDFHTPAFLTVEPGTFVDLTTANVPPPPEIATGFHHSLALRADGSAVAWGWNDNGQTNVPVHATNMTAIATGYGHSLALQPDGSVIAWGWNDDDQCTIPATVANVTAIAAGYYHSLALREDGSIVAWGHNGYSQCDIPVHATNVVAIAAGSFHNLALRSDGSVIAWGHSYYGQCTVPANATNVAAIAAGRHDSLALRSDGSVVAWGYNAYGQCTVPVHATNVVAIAAGAYHSLALRDDGSVVAWGSNGDSQCTVPANATNMVTLVAAGYDHSLALRSDGSVVAWGGNSYGQCDIPGTVNIPNPPIAVDGTVATNLGTYVLDYSTTNTLGAIATATRTVVVATLPIITTETATGIGADQATLRGSANPRASETLAWFEYGLGGSYGQETLPIPLGNPTNAVPFSTGRSELLPYMTYHYRAVASNGIGRANGSDRFFTLSAPSFGTPSLSELPDLVLAQGGGTSVWFTATPAGVDVRVECNNPVLLPEGSLVLGGSSLGIAPDPNHSGSAQVTVTASDGMQSARQTFTLTVGPVDPSQLLNLESQTMSGGTWRLQVYDDGTASTNYVMEYRPDLSPTSTWSAAANVVDLGGGEYEVDLGAAQGDAGFYRIKGFRMLQAGFDSAETSAEEGSGAAGVVVVLNSIFTGTLDYTWTDETGTTYAGTVEVDGTTVVIPLPAAFLDDDTGIGQLEHLVLVLDGGSGDLQTGDTESRITIEENDAVWQGMIETDSGRLGFTLTMLQTGGTFNGRIQSEGFGFFPTNALVQLAFAEDTFTAVATDIPLPVFEDDPELGFINYLDLRLDAANRPGETNVGPDRIEGEATLVVQVPGQPYLDAAATGPFVLFRPPTAASTNEVPLQPVP